MQVLITGSLLGTERLGAQIVYYLIEYLVSNFHHDVAITNLLQHREIIFIPMPTMQELREGLWIDRATRLIIIDFTLYNANINMFCIAKVELTLKQIRVTCRCRQNTIN